MKMVLHERNFLGLSEQGGGGVCESRKRARVWIGFFALLRLRALSYPWRKGLRAAGGVRFIKSGSDFFRRPGFVKPQAANGRLALPGVCGVSSPAIVLRGRGPIRRIDDNGKPATANNTAFP
ncbi:MAG: hypothetical protein LBP52_00695 [Burkholderiaceae bacterium]|jgi:hypothetical protein|nr:hypothetical protein [Burkholderiaceae bacterium]